MTASLPNVSVCIHSSLPGIANQSPLSRQIMILFPRVMCDANHAEIFSLPDLPRWPELENGSGLEHQITRHNMGVKPVFSVTVFADRIPEPALGIAELGAANVSEPHREIDRSVIFRTADLNR